MMTLNDYFFSLRRVQHDLTYAPAWRDPYDRSANIWNDFELEESEITDRRYYADLDFE